MPCRFCGSENRQNFRSEIAVHLRKLDQPHVFVFPEIVVCVNCGEAEFVEEFVFERDKLYLLAKRTSDAAG